jgi:hypothetical protein
VESFILIAVPILAVIGSYFIIKINWKKYGVLFLMSAIAAYIFCALFIFFNFYSYPYRLLPALSSMPLASITTVFPFYVLLGVRYSPKFWGWKIPFYWVFVHMGVFLETLAIHYTNIIKYEQFWDLWDSYTWWWIFLLIFEWIGGLLVPSHDRKPIHIKHLRYGRLGWFIIHFILIITIFLAGYYTGRVT